MKKIIILTLICLFTFETYAQNSGKGFSYQAVARNTDGQVKASENIEVRFSLLPGAFAQQPTWQETHVATTDEFGVFSLTIGKGIRSGGTVNEYSNIDYGASEFWLKVEVMDNGTFQEISNTQLLSVPYAEVAGNAQPAPTGSIMAFGGMKEKIPSGWHICDGTELSRIDFANLYDAIGTNWGSGNNSTTFRIPDMRGVFLRGVSDGKTNYDNDRNSRSSMYSGGNTNDNVGSFQAEGFKSHDHSGNINGDPILPGPSKIWNDIYHKRGDYPDIRAYEFRTNKSPNNRSITINSTGGTETRPDNVYVYYIIKL